jgi:hypothetical protein
VRVLRICFTGAMLACSGFGQAAAPSTHNVSAKIAKQIAESELIRVYGQAIKAEGPFAAKLENGAWTVTRASYCQELLPARGFWCRGYHWAAVSRDGRIITVGRRPSGFMSPP